MAKVKTQSEQEVVEVLNLRGGRFSIDMLIPEGVKYLDLTENSLTSLEGISFPDSLKILKLGSNQINSLAGIEFPSGLKTLDLTENLLTSLRGVSFPDGLEVLYLNNNQITSLVDAELPSGLKTLALLRCNIISVDRVKLPDSLTDVSLQGNKITSVPEGFLPDGIDTVDLSDNDISSLGDVYLPDSVEVFYCDKNKLQSLEGFSAPSSLIVFDVVGNSIKSFEQGIFPKSIEKIDFDDNPIELLDISKLPRELEGCYFGHKDLKISNLDDFPVGLKTFFVHKSQHIKSLKGFVFPDGLKTIDLSHTALDSLQDAKFPDSVEEIVINATSVKSFAGVSFPGKCKVIEAEGVPLESLDDFVAPRGLQELILTKNEVLNISKESLNSLSSMMLNSIVVDEEFSGEQMIDSFNSHQREKIMDIIKFAKNFDLSYVRSFEEKAKLLQAFFYIKNCNCVDREIVSITSKDDVSRISSLVSSVVQRSALTQEGNSGGGLFTKIKTSLPAVVESLILDYYFGEDFSGLFKDYAEFKKTFFFGGDKRSHDADTDEESSKRLRAEEPNDDQDSSSMVSLAAGSGVPESILNFDLAQALFEEYGLNGESFDMDDIG